MARFGQSFLASLTQPSYGQGLFELGGAIGQAPALAAEKKRRDAMMEELMSGSPIQQARVLQQEGARTGNLSLVLQAKQAEQDELDKGIQQGIAAIKGKMLTMPDSELDAAEENLVAYVKGVGGDLTQAYGAAEEVRRTKRKQEQDRMDYEETVREKQEQDVINTFYSVPVENRKKFLEGAANKGFGDLAARLEIRENERALDAEKINNALKDKTTPVDTSGLEQRIAALPDETASKADLEQRLAGVLEQMPDFKAGETFNAGQRTVLLKEVQAINDDIARTAAATDQANLIAQRQLEGDIRTMRARAANFDPSNAEIEAEARRLDEEAGKWSDSYSDYEAQARENLIQKQIQQTEKVIADLQGKKEPASGGDSTLGSSTNPYKPTTKEELDKIPSGQLYINPNTGKLTRKN